MFNFKNFLKYRKGLVSGVGSTAIYWIIGLLAGAAFLAGIAYTMTKTFT